nr:outer membrane protein [Salmonella sp. NCTC 7297]
MAAPGSCERVKSDIEQRIINNGVPADNFTLTIVPNDQAISRTHRWWAIARTTRHKILYTRTNSGNAPANTSPAQDGSSAEPQ